MRYLILILSLILFNSPLFPQEPVGELGYKNLKISPKGNTIIFSHQEFPGFYFLNLSNYKTELIEDNKFSAYGASFSADGKYVAYKRFVTSDNSKLQQPVLYNIHNGKTIALFNPVVRCGTPSISDNGKILFTVGKILHVVNTNGDELKTIKLPSYANLTPVSPSGNFVVFNDKKDRLWLLNILTEETRLLTETDKGYFEPLWSSDNKKIVTSTMSGELVVFNIVNNSIMLIGKGKHPVWTEDSNHLVYSKAEILLNRAVLSQDLYSFDIISQNETRLSNSTDREDYPAISGNSIYYSLLNSGKFVKAELMYDKNSIELLNPSKVNLELNSKNTIPEFQYHKKKDLLSAVYFDIPYVNQRYDTPDWFNGNWACGATAASQCLSYFGLLRQWPVWVSTPYSHISDYGNYICEIYTYNGYTFNIGGRDPNGTIGYGGYGFVIQNNWANTKDYMKQYAQIHGLGSAVDWNPTRSKLATEITNEDPFVLLNSLTTSGHYISVIGYDNTDTTTVIVNDPYGDKNLGYANFYGRRAWYDWPGYNNGYENLNTVHCYIYFRGDPPSDLTVQYFTTQVDTATVCQKIAVFSEVANIGNLASIASTIEFFVSENGVHDENAYILNTFTLPALHVGQTYILQDSISLPDSLISDTYKLSVFADADTINKEMLKDNNVMSKNIVLYGYPRLYGILPEANSVINNQRPAIRVKYQDWITRIDTANVKLYLDNFDFTDSSIVGIRRIDYTPGYDLIEGLHQLRVEVPSNFGLMATYNWDFEIQLASKIDDKTTYNPNEFYLAQNYPNPFNPNTFIEFNLPKAGNVSLNVYNLNGEIVAELIKNEYYNSGNHKLIFNAKSLASGVYIYTIRYAKNSLTKKMLLLR